MVYILEYCTALGFQASNLASDEHKASSLFVHVSEGAFTLSFSGPKEHWLHFDSSLKAFTKVQSKRSMECLYSDFLLD